MKSLAKFLAQPASLCLAAALLLPGTAHAQGRPSGFWTAPDANAAHTNWQKAEKEISPGTVTKNFKFLWKLKLGAGENKSTSFTEPLLYPGLITGRGFKDMALVAGQNTVYSVDSELGELIWTKEFPDAHSSCGNLQIVTEAPPVIHFGPPPTAPKPGAAAPPPPPRRPPEAPLPKSERRVGASPGGGYFGLRGVYVLTPDGYMHEQIMATGLDYAPPVKFLPSALTGDSFGLNMNEKVAYAETGTGCRDTAAALYSIDLNNAAYPVSNFKAEKARLAGVTGPAIAPDGTVYVSAGGVFALDPGDLKVKDSWTPTAAGKSLHAGPVVFSYKEKQWIVAPGANGTLVLLDTASLGGPDHHTPIAQTQPLIRGSRHNAWEALASAPDGTGGAWVFASIAGPIASDVKFPANTTAPAHGSIVAFKVEEKDGHPALTPAWVSRDLINPAPPAVANGVVFALDGGSPSRHATLYALDAATGKQLYSSEDAIQSYSHLAGMSIGDGHVFFTTHDNTLYSFGIPLEH